MKATASQEASAHSQQELSSSCEDRQLRLGHLAASDITKIAFILVGSKAFLMFPSLVIMAAGSAAWIALILSSALATFALWGWGLWSRETEGLSLVDSLEVTLGSRLVGDTLALCLAAGFLVISSLNIRVFAGGAVVSVLPDVPIEVLTLIVSFSAMYAAWLGIETVARAVTFFLPIVTVSLVLVFGGAARLFDIRHLFPFWGFGPINVLKQGVLHTGIFGIAPALTVLKSYTRDTKIFGKNLANGTLVAGAFLVFTAVAVAASFPYPEGARQVCPLEVVARTVTLGRLLERAESVFTFTWFFASTLQASTGYVVILVLLAQVGKCHTYRPLVPGLLTLSWVIELLPLSVLRAEQVLNGTLLSFGNVALSLGWAMFAIAKIRRVKAQLPAGTEGREQGQDEQRKPPRSTTKVPTPQPKGRKEA